MATTGFKWRDNKNMHRITVLPELSDCRTTIAQQPYKNVWHTIFFSMRFVYSKH